MQYNLQKSDLFRPSLYDLHKRKLDIVLLKSRNSESEKMEAVCWQLPLEKAIISSNLSIQSLSIQSKVVTYRCLVQKVCTFSCQALILAYLQEPLFQLYDGF